MRDFMQRKKTNALFPALAAAMMFISRSAKRK